MTILPHLDVFCKAAELASFTKAARSLGMTQAGVSQHVRALEKELSVSLFHRRAGRVELSEAGKTLYGYAQRILALHVEARTAMGRTPLGLRGQVSVAASTIPAERFLPNVLDEFHSAFPDVRVVVTVGDSLAVTTQIERGDAEIVIVGCPIETPWAESMPLARDRLAVIVAATHRWAKSDHLSLDELAGHPLVIREPGSGTRRCLERALADLGHSLSGLSIHLELGSNQAIRETVAQGNVAGILSVAAVSGDLASGRLREVAVEGLSLDRSLFAVIDRRRVLPAPALALWGFLQSHAPLIGLP